MLLYLVVDTWLDKSSTDSLKCLAKANILNVVKRYGPH